MALLLLWLAIAGAAHAEPDQRITGTLAGADHQTYKAIPFVVPDGVERITITLAYDKADRTVVDLGMWDPQRFRGWSGGSRDRFTIGVADASPGYLPGTILPGRWQIMLGIPNIRKASRSSFELTVTFDRRGSRVATAAITDPPLSPRPGWYRGDLHMHDANSDGSCASQAGKRVPCPLFRTIEAAAAAGLDFVAVTDHNTVAHFNGLRELQPYFDKILLIPGIEITTFSGHANLFGPSGFVDFRIGTRKVPTISALEDAALASGGILSLNHPAAPSGEDCMGCGWTWRGTDYRKVAAIEVVNGAVAEGRYGGLGFWYGRLNQGDRLTGIGGSDNHDPDAPAGKPPIGRPTTVIYAAALSQDAILEGIRAGNVFIDVEGRGEKLLEVHASDGARRAPMGGTLSITGEIQVDARVVGAAGAEATLIADGEPVGHQPVATGEQLVSFRHVPPPTRWISVNVRAADGRLLLIGNPVYVAGTQISARMATKRP